MPLPAGAGVKMTFNIVANSVSNTPLIPGGSIGPLFIPITNNVIELEAFKELVRTELNGRLTANETENTTLGECLDTLGPPVP